MKLLTAVYPICIIIPVLLSVAFFTLIERKFLGISQNRKGPCTEGNYGVFQPIADGIKLFSKGLVVPNGVNFYLFILCPIIGLSVSLVVWIYLPLEQLGYENIKMNLILLIAIGSIGIYPVIGAGWASNSKYSLLGALRGGAQMISYEVSLGLILIALIMLIGSFSIIKYVETQQITGYLLIPCLPVAIIMFISSVAETNRAPFDLAEGESELVSGFNVEYSGMAFALFFLSEYSHIILLSFLLVLLFISKFNLIIKNFIFLKLSFLLTLFIWIRSSFPRVRYNSLMSFFWKNILPIMLTTVIIFLLLLVI